MITKNWFSRCWQWKIGGCVALVGTLSVGVSERVFAQIVPDNTLGAEGSVVTPNVNIQGIPSDRIDGGATRGANLFHSFQEFNVGEGRGVYFANPTGIENILTRVTGSNPSNILGRLGVLGGANLLLLNPNGIIFGPNAQLNVEGSFLASTASSFTFSDGSEFSATNPQASPLLTISVPLGLQYGSNPGSVQVQGSNLQVNPGKTLALVGGSVSMDGGQLQASGGRIELGGLAGTGTIELSVDSTGNLLSLSFPDGVERADFSIINGAVVDVAAGGGGSIAVTVRNLDISGKGNLSAGIGEKLGSVGAVGGDITVDATGTVTLQGSSVIQNQVNSGATGNAGNINVDAGSLYLLSGSQLFMSTFGQGNADTVNVNVRDIVSIDSAGDNASNSGIINSFAGTSVGKGGDINITTGSLSVTNGAQLNTITFAQGDAGNVNIDARETVSFDGANVGASGILSAVRPEAVGNGGDITITTGSLSVTNGAQLNAITRGQGNAGNVTINARDTISLDGENPNSIVDQYAGVSTILTAVSIDDNGKQAVGNGGDITITTGALSLTNGAQLNAITRGQGNAGNVTINARDTISLDGERQKSATRAASAIFTAVDGNEYSGYPNLGPAIGDGGDINITTESLSVTRGAALSTLTEGQGNAGNVTINVRDTISFDGENSKGGSSGIFSSVADNLYTGQPPAVGDGGNVDITTGSLSITKGAGVFANTRGQGNAGRVIINARDTVSIDGEKKSNRAASGVFSSVGDKEELPPTIGNGGDIYITTGSFSATRGGGVFTSTSGQGNAGNLTVTAPQAVTLSGNSQLLVETTGDGAAGDLMIETGRLTVTDGATVSSSTSSPNPDGVGGNITVNATQSLDLTDGGRLLAQSNYTAAAAGSIEISTEQLTARDGALATSSEQSSGGGITITADKIRLFGDSDIITNVNQGAGGGGNIYLKAGSILAFDDSDILAYAQDGKGGDITFDTPAFFSENYRPAPRNTDPATLDNNNRVDVNASSAVSGVITIPDVSFIQNSLTELPENQIDTNSLLANSCIVRRNQPTRGSLIITGTGGLPQRPGDAQMSSFPTVDVETLPSDGTFSNTNPHRPWQKGDPIVEPQGVYRLPNGKLVLSRECS